MRRAAPSARLFFSATGDHRVPPSFPTRRSSDLSVAAPPTSWATSALSRGEFTRASIRLPRRYWLVCRRARQYLRSEEHTSELQSHSDLVCRLLLEKKKQQ